MLSAQVYCASTCYIHSSAVYMTNYSRCCDNSLGNRSDVVTGCADNHCLVEAASAVLMTATNSTLPLAKYPLGYASGVGALSSSRHWEMESKLFAEFHELDRTKILCKDVRRVIISINIEDVDDSLVINLLDVVVTDVDVFRP